MWHKWWFLMLIKLETLWSLENIVRKGENAFYLHFLTVSQCFLASPFMVMLKDRIVWWRVNPFCLHLIHHNCLNEPLQTRRSLGAKISELFSNFCGRVTIVLISGCFLSGICPYLAGIFFLLINMLWMTVILTWIFCIACSTFLTLYPTMLTLNDPLKNYLWNYF